MKGTFLADVRIYVSERIVWKFKNFDVKYQARESTSRASRCLSVILITLRGTL